jgi:zinc protease
MRLKKLPTTVAAALAVLLAASAHAQQALEPGESSSEANGSADPEIPFEKLTLPNGLEVILHQDQSVPLIAVSVWYHVGSGDETPGKSGFAHLFEHMMFQGTKNTGEDKHFEILREIGASNTNGSTNYQRTNYYEVVPSNQLEVALWLESERMGYLLPSVTEASLANQRDVVRNERRQRYDNVPYGKERFAINAALYPEGHPYRYLVIGRHEDIESASVEDVKNFFRKWYVPANATLAIAGDFEVAEAKRLVQKWFGSFPASQRPERRMVPAPALQKPERITLDDAFAKLRRVRYVFHSPALFAPGDAELDLLASALGKPGTGRLYKILVLERQLAQSVSVYQASAQMSSTFHVTVDLKPDADLAEVERILDEELERVRKEPITEREIARAIVSYESGFVWGLESLLARAEILQSYNHAFGDPDGITRDLDRYRKTTAAAVQAVAASVLDPQRRVEIVSMPASEAAATPAEQAAPEASAAQSAPGADAQAAAAAAASEAPVAELAFPEEDFRAQRPAAGEPRPLEQPAITRFALPNGIEVFLVERHELPTVSMDLTFEGGSAGDPAEQQGLAGLCMGLVDEGTAGLEKIAFEEALADLASNVSSWAGSDQQGVGMSTLTKNLDRTLELWTDTLRAPGLREQDHGRLVKQSVAAIRQAKGAPASIATRVSGSVFFGPEHPLGRVTTEQSIEAVALSDCRRYVQEWLRPDGAKLFVVGDATQAELEEKLSRLFAGWAGKPPQPAEEQPHQPRDGRIFFVDVPGAAQSRILMAHPGPRRQAPDYFATRLMMGILGGSFSSRINMNLREDKGYAYGAGAGLAYSRNFGTLRVGASVRSDVTRESVDELLGELSRMSSGEIAEAELARESSAAILGLPGDFATGAQVLGSFRSLVYFGLPLDWYASFVQNVSAVTKEAAEQAARAHIKPDQLKIVVVGDGASALPALRELAEARSFGEGAIVLMDADANLLPQPPQAP